MYIYIHTYMKDKGIKKGCKSSLAGACVCNTEHTYTLYLHTHTHTHTHTNTHTHTHTHTQNIYIYIKFGGKPYTAQIFCTVFYLSY